MSRCIYLGRSQREGRPSRFVYSLFPQRSPVYPYLPSSARGYVHELTDQRRRFFFEQCIPRPPGPRGDRAPDPAGRRYQVFKHIQEPGKVIRAPFGSKNLLDNTTQLTKEQLLTVLPHLAQHLRSNNYVACTYAAVAIERILFIRRGSVVL